MTGASGRAGFGDRLAEAVGERGSQLVLGLDPDPAQLWPRRGAFGDDRAPASDRPDEAAAHAVVGHCEQVIDATAEQCVAVKLQAACFERLGAPGWLAMSRLTQSAHERGLLVILDAKRGDIDVTAAAYAQAFFGETSTPFGPVSGLGVDALTVNPLLGSDSIAPLLTGARARGAGLLVLVRTSNPGASEIQDLALAAGGSVSDRLATMVASLGVDGVGSSGLSDVGAVVGATAPELIERLRDRMPNAVLLLPGVGAQGGNVEALGAAFAPGPAGGLITASRAIVHAHRDRGGEPAAAALAEASRLRELAWSLGGG